MTRFTAANSFSDGSVTVRTSAPSACSTRAASSTAAVTSGCAGLSSLMEMPHEADAQVAHAAIQHAAEIAARCVGGAAGVGRVVPGDRIQQQRVVGHRAGHRPDMVQREGQREHAAPRHQPVGRLQPDDAAGAGRIAHRTAGVGAQRQRKQPGARRRRRSRRRSRPDDGPGSTGCAPAGTAGRSSGRRWRTHASTACP